MNQFDSITFDRNGKAIGVGKTEIYSQYERPYLTMGKFYSNNTRSQSDLTSKEPWFYMCPGAYVHEDRTNDEIDLRDVAVVSDNTIKTSEVVTSTDPNAYTVSDSPDAEGWYYEKLPDIQMYPLWGDSFHQVILVREPPVHLIKTPLFFLLTLKWLLYLKMIVSI